MNWINKLRIWYIKLINTNRTVFIRVPNTFTDYEVNSIIEELKNIGIDKFIITNDKIKVTVIKGTPKKL